VTAPVRLATRGSQQASTQARAVADQLRAATGRDAELVIVETTGDRRQDVPLHVIGGQGVFVKEVQQAVLDGRADAAVHSAKDLPSVSADGLVLAAFTRRRDPADALVGRSLAELSDGATVATGSVRRRAQLAVARPDLRFTELRGNIATRLDRIPEDGAIVMAVAALEVLGLTDRIAERLDPARYVPAIGQGCVAVESRSDDEETIGLLATIDDPDTRHAVEVERAFLGELGAGCALPVGAHVADGRLRTFLASSDQHDRHVDVIVASDDIELAGDDGDLERAREAARAARKAVGWGVANE
jgi:hydroxymethylbilane synthase